MTDYIIPSPPILGEDGWGEKIIAGHNAQTAAIADLDKRISDVDLESVQEVIGRAENAADAIEAGIDTSDGVVSALITNPNSATLASLNVTFPARVKLSDLPTPVVISHHVGGAIPACLFPPSSRSAIKLALARGERIIDLDVQETKDGLLICWHDSTTADFGEFNVNPTQVVGHQLPQIDARHRIGPGWEPEPILSLEEVFIEFGGKACFFIELKSNANAMLPKVAQLVHKYGLSESVLVNFAPPYGNFAADVINAGLKFAVHSCTTTAHVSAAILDGASMILIPVTASTELIEAAKGIRNNGGLVIMQGPIGRRPFGIATLAEKDTVDAAGVDGYISDALGYLEADSRPIATSITSSLASGKAGIGWVARNPYDFPRGTKWLDPSKGILTAKGGKANRIALRDLAGDYGAHYKIDFTVTFDELPETTTQFVGIRFACPDDVLASNGSSPAHKGYMAGIQANGAVRAWKSNGTADSSLANVTSTAATVGVGIPVTVEVTETQIKVTRTDTNASTGWLSDSEWRGEYLLTTTTLSTGEAWIKSLSITAISEV